MKYVLSKQKKQGIISFKDIVKDIKTQNLKNVVVIGGGHGLSNILKALKGLSLNITALTNVFDSGGSTGELKEKNNIFGIGDLRKALLALSNNEKILENITEYRINDYNNHALGNIIIKAMFERYDDIEIALNKIHKIFDVSGKVIPISYDKAEIIAELENGYLVEKEHKIDKGLHPYRWLKIKRIWLKPEAKITDQAYNAIKKADYIIISSGDLYTSIIPNFLVKGFKQAIKESKANIIYIANILTKPFETHNYTLKDHVLEIEKYLGKEIDLVIVNNKKVFNEYTKKYFKKGYRYVKNDLNEKEIITKDFVLEKDIKYHDPSKLEKVFKDIFDLQPILKC